MPFNSILDGINPMASSHTTSNLSPSPQQSLLRPRADAYPAIATTQSKQFENYRRFGDIPPEDLRKMIYANTLQAFQSLPAAANSRYNLSLRDVGYDGKEEFSLAEQKKAILSRGTLGRKVHGTWVLSDVEGNEIAQKPTTLGRVPYLTGRGTFIYNGTEYTINNQMRLRPGVYTRTKENSEVESHVNVSKGMGHKISLDPGTGVFRVEIGQAKIPLTPLLQAMGVSDAQLKDAWGSELAATNIQKKDVKAIDKLYAKLKKNGDATDQQTKAEQVAEAFRQMEVDPDVVEETLGNRYTNVDETTLLAVTKRLLGVMRGEEEPDDRDAMQYQKILGPEDFFAERVSHSQAVARNLLWKASATGTLDKLPSSAFKDSLASTIVGSGLAQAIEQINMGETLDQQTRVTRMGYGGIPSNDSVPLDARAVHPSQVGFLDLLRTPESASVGVDLRLANTAVKGPDGNLYSKLRDLKGNDSYLTPREFARHTIAFPGELAKDKEYVPALRGGKMIVAPRDEVDYEIPHMEDTFSALNNLVPMKSMIQGQRSSMASRMIAQALPLERPEAPLVQSGIPGEKGRSYEQKYGEKLGALRAKQPGRVMQVTPQAITVKYAGGETKTHELLHYMPNNRKTLSHQTAVVRPGDVVEPDQLLARSNVTDDQGTVSLGVNARVAYIAYAGKNYEDAIAISESMAKRFTSEHGYQHEHEWGGTDKKGLKQFISAFPTKYDKKLLENFSPDGVIKPGTVVNEHDPLILVASERELTKKSLMRGGRSYADKSLTWDHHTPGEVTDVVETPKGVNVVVRSLMPMQEADKMSGRMGDKGVVRIIPDDQMPTDENGEPFEVLLNPLGIISRRNPAQIVEAVLGKIAAKTGEPYRLPDFEGTEDMVEFAIDELRKHKMKDLEPVIDPRTGRKIDGILTGNRWFMKLHHSASGKEQGRGIGGYSADGEPAKGGSTGSKKIGLLETSALLSHGAGEYLRDAKLHRGQAQPEFWSQYMSGYDPPPPRVPHVYEKFVDSLKASGINVVRDGPRTHIMALTDKDVDQLSGGREIKNASTVNWKNMEPIKGGLFDETLVGGHGGGRWAHIKLHEPLPSPVMEEPIRRLLGLTTKQFEGIISGEEELGGLRGPKALAKALERIDLPKAIEQAREDIKSGKKTARDAAIRKLGYLKSAERLKIHPKDWMLSKVPVLPPIFRPVSTMGDKKLPLVADPNYLYKEVLDANQAIKDLSKQLGEDGVGEERLQLYRAFKGVTGLGDPIHPKNQERNVGGILKTVFGNSPKRGTVQSKLLGSTVDLVGRGVTVPESNFDMDTIGLPETKIWDVFRPQVMRKLVRNGYSRAAAAQAIEDKSDVAKKVLQDEVENGVVVVSRAPTLHRYGVMAFRPKITKGHAIRVNPLVYAGYNLDNDGNCCDYDEIIKLDIDEVVVNNTRVGKQFLTQLSETVMRLYSQELINLSVNGRVCVSLPIGEVPRVGEPTINAKGQKLYAVPEGVDICSYDHDSGRVIRTEITGLTVDEAHATVRVTTARGRDVIVSDNESLAVFDTVSGQLIKMRPDEAIGKHVPYIRKEPHPGDSLNRDIGWWYAVMTADGWKTARMVGYSKNDETCRREVERIARTQLHENFVRYEYSADKADGDSKYGKSCKIHLNGGDLAAIVWEISRPKPADRLQDRTALYKSLPPQLLSAAGEECLLGIFSGLLDGDSAFVVNASHAKKGRKPQMLCRFQTSSKFFRNDILQVCRYLGIRTAITYSPPRGSSNEAWIIIPSTVDLKQIAHKLTCVRADAIAWLRDFESYEVTRDNMDIVPILPTEAVELAAIARNHREHTLYTTAMVSKKAGYIGRQSALRLLALAGDSDASTLRRMANCHDIHWDTVKSIEDTGVRDVFDLMIPETKVFPLANGLVIYDTMNYHTPFSPEAKEEALAKMLPSRNLFDTNSFKAHYTPTNEYVIGLYEASARKDVSRKPITFRTKQDAIAAYKRGEIGVGQPIEVLET